MKNKMTALLISIFLGPVGIDRFYLGYTGMGILKLLTGGLFGFLYVYDIIMIATGKLRPADGAPYDTKLPDFKEAFENDNSGQNNTSQSSPVNSASGQTPPAQHANGTSESNFTPDPSVDRPTVNRSVNSDHSQKASMLDDPRFQRIALMLADEEFDRALTYCESLLDQNPENAIAYLGELLCETKARSLQDLPEKANALKYNYLFKKALQFGDNVLKQTLTKLALDEEEIHVKKERQLMVRDAIKNARSDDPSQEELYGLHMISGMLTALEDKTAVENSVFDEAAVSEELFNSIFEKALQVLESNTTDKTLIAAGLLKLIEGYVSKQEVPESVLKEAPVSEAEPSGPSSNNSNAKSSTPLSQLICPYCGAPLDEDSVFCENCGKKIRYPMGSQ